MSGPALTIRAVSANDLDALLGYLDEQLAENGSDGAPLFQPLPRSVTALPSDKRESLRAGTLKGLDAPGWRRIWVAVDHAGMIAGHIDLRARPEPTATHRALLGMGVRRDWRRRGAGSALLASALHWARSTGLAWVDLEVLSANAPALALYQRSGFMVTGQNADMFRIDGEQLGYTFMSIALKSDCQ